MLAPDNNCNVSSSFNDFLIHEIVHLNKYRAELKLYKVAIKYVLLSDGIQAEKLFKEIKDVEISVVQNLASDPKEKELLDLSQHLSLTEKLLNFSLTPDEWREYQQGKNKFNNQNLSLESFENFYHQYLVLIICQVFLT